MNRHAQRGALFVLIAVVAIVVATRLSRPVSSPPSSLVAPQVAPAAPRALTTAVDDLEDRLAHLTNEQRRRVALRPLDRDPALSAAARSHSEDMLRREFFDHVNPDRETPADRVARIAHLTGAIGENIWQWSESHHVPSATLAAQAVADWMESAAHRANILRPGYTRFGVGSATHGSDVRLTELFME
jgi:uncharacterized protein YkwD